MSDRVPSVRVSCSMAGLALAIGCAEEPPPPAATPATAAIPAGPSAPGRPARPPQAVRIDPLRGDAARKTAGFAALEQELGRAMKELGAKGDPAPYFIGYEVHDRREVTISAEHGALLQSSDRRNRVLDVDVRVGSHKLDSTHPMRAGGFDFDFSAFGGGSAALPLDDAPAAIRAVAWAATDKRYKSAVERLTKIKTQKQVRAAEEDQSDDFSKEKPVTFVEPPASVAVDVAAWEARVRRLSARFRSAPELHDSQAMLQVATVNKWLANSEGSSIQTGRSYVRVFLQAETRADDGMELQRYETFDAADFAGLPDEATMEKAADAIIADLRGLRKAPLAEPFAGPAILEGKAAGVFFHEIFGHRVEGHRQKKEDEGQTFAKKVGEAVMPDFVSVYDDPSVRRIGGEDLNGFYRFDDEAVPAQRAVLIDKGVMRGFLMARSPTRGFNQSNGHGRRQEGRSVVARQGNLVVEPTHAVSPAELRQRLRDEAKRQGKAYGLLFKDISGGFTFTGRYLPQAFKVLPILVYRVWVDGRPDELVRGADLVGTPLASLSKILAAADDYQTFNGYCGAESGFVPVSATSPSLLVQQIEVERKEKGSAKPPILPAPELPASAGAGPAPADDAAVRRALDDEMKRAVGGLRMADEPRPYFVSYTVNDVDFLQVGATFGAVTAENRNRARTLRTQVRVGDPAFDNSNFQDGGASFFSGGGFGQLPIEDDPVPLRRNLWLRSDEAYKGALETLSKKKAAAASQAAAEDDKVPDFAPQPKAETVAAPAIAPPDPAPLRDLATRLSALFQSTPGIATSRVNAAQAVGRQRFLSSEGTWADERDGFVRIDVSAETQADDGMKLKDTVSFSAPSVAALGPFGEMERAVRKMADELGALKKAPLPETGNAVVLFEGTAAAQIVKALMAEHLSGTPPPKTAGNEARGGRQTASEFAGKIGQKVAATLLSVWDDPRQQSGPGKAFLFGAYHADDEGVPAQRVSLVEKGILKSLLMSRTPSKEIARSNGHGRQSRTGASRGHIGNLFVAAQGGLGRSALLDRMARQAKSGSTQAFVVRLLDDPGGAPFGDFDDIEGMFVFFGGGSRGGGAAPIRPLVAYRLKDGKEELVRGFTLEGMLPKSLKDVLAAGKESVTYNFIDGPGASGSPSAIVTPALLFGDVEVRKQTGRNKKPPLYPHPSFAGK